MPPIKKYKNICNYILTTTFKSDIFSLSTKTEGEPMTNKRLLELAKMGLQAQIVAISKIDIEYICKTGEHNDFYYSELQKLTAEMEQLITECEKVS